MQTNLSIYMDDGLCYHANFEQHLAFLRPIFEKLKASRLRFNPKKTMFARDSLIFWGFRFSDKGQDIDEERFQKIKDVKPASNLKEVKMLLGLFSYYQKLVPRFAIISSPIRQLLRKCDDSGKEIPFEWGIEQDNALGLLKEALLQNVLLVFPDMNDTFYIQTDASKNALAHCLLQKKYGVLRPISFGGRAFKQHETRLSATEQELMGVLHAIEAYRQFIGSGKKFVILTDHCSLQFIKNLKYSTSSKLVRYSLLLQHLDFDVIPIKGRSNILSDFLSRCPIEERDSEETNSPSHDSLLDVDHYNFLTAIDVEQLAQDFHVNPRYEDKQRKRNYRVYEILPLQTQNENSDSQSTNKRNKRKRKSKQKQNTPRNAQDSTVPAATAVQTNTDEKFMSDDDSTRLFDEMNQQLRPIINLESQANDDPLISALIEYLKTEQLPGDKDLANRVLFRHQDYLIIDEQLFHLARVNNKKRSHLMLPRQQQLYVPKPLRLSIMEKIHNFSHFGYIKSFLTAKVKYYWENMAGDFKTFVDSCLVCQQIKSSPQPKYPLTGLPVSSKLFETLHIDFHTVTQDKRFKNDNIYRHVLVLIDQFSQHVTMIPCKDQTASTAAQSIMDHFILKYGCFRYLISDRGSSWLNQLFQAFLKMPAMKIFHYKTSPYFPQSNSICELQNTHIVRMLRAYCTDRKQFHELLPAICAGVNGSYNTSLGCSSHFLLYGQEYQWPIDTALTNEVQSIRDDIHPPGLEGIADRFRVLRNIVYTNVTESRKDNERLRNEGRKPHDFKIGDRVFVSQVFESSKIQNPKHSASYVGPYAIVDLNGSVVRLQHYFTGKVLRNWINVTHLRRLRDEGRLKLYNRLNAQNSDANIVSGTDQPTVQTAIQLYFTERGRGCVANDPSGPIDCDSTPTQQQQGLHGPQTVCHTASTADFSVPRTAQLLSPDAPEWYPQGHETDFSPCFETQLRPTDIVQSVALHPMVRQIAK